LTLPVFERAFHHSGCRSNSPRSRAQSPGVACRTGTRSLVAPADGDRARRACSV